ncbi:MAG TPA: cytochrome C [Tahibacter sp.]|uniref:cytochrome C n=1 Tax=Tahibacter sp. TaxID=2056211 RepID=UPI002C19FF3C|nr:cytochrome C [Tahibacter sp.]HSX61530.1 cytochrome C [Tahibacter sp.]
MRNILLLLALALAAPTLPAADDAAVQRRGRELLFQSGCHDCHTPGFAMNGGKADESVWLIGDQLGWNGPWGTTYPTNLRLRLATMSRDEWRAYARVMKSRPPMPFWVLNQMSDTDLDAIWQVVQTLGKAGAPAPAALPPGVEPQGPAVRFPSPPAGVAAQ